MTTNSLAGYKGTRLKRTYYGGGRKKLDLNEKDRLEHFKTQRRDYARRKAIEKSQTTWKALISEIRANNHLEIDNLAQKMRTESNYHLSRKV